MVTVVVQPPVVPFTPETTNQTVRRVTGNPLSSTSVAWMPLSAPGAAWLPVKLIVVATLSTAKIRDAVDPLSRVSPGNVADSG